MAAAAAAVAAIGSRVVSPRAGLAAGLVFAAVPSTSLYAQNARPDALAVALAAGATYLLVRILQSGGTSRRWLVAYGACLTALGLINILCLLLTAAHAVTVATAAIREKDRSARRALVLRWLLAASVAIVLVSPLILRAFAERDAVNWIKPPDLGGFRELAGVLAPMQQAHTSSVPFALGILAIIGGGLLVSAAGRRARLRKRWPLDIAAICLPWLILPPAILLGASLFEPIYNPRFILFCVPALTLLTGTALAALGRAAGPAALVVITLLGLPAQQAARQPDGHGENIRLADHIVAADMHRGDAAIFNNRTEESWTFAYRYGFAELADIGQAETPAQSGTLTGTSLPAAVVRRRLSRLPRVWVVDVRYRVRAPKLDSKDFRLARRWRVDDIWLFLYTRQRHVIR
jgi:mannosyltransferase